jgi:hypothetical protein
VSGFAGNLDELAGLVHSDCHLDAVGSVPALKDRMQQIRVGGSAERGPPMPHRE